MPLPGVRNCISASRPFCKNTIFALRILQKYNFCTPDSAKIQFLYAGFCKNTIFVLRILIPEIHYTISNDARGYMITIHKNFIVDAHGNPKAVIIPLEDFQKIEEMLGLDLDKEAFADLGKAREDRESGNMNAYMDLK